MIEVAHISDLNFGRTNCATHLFLDAGITAARICVSAF